VVDVTHPNAREQAESVLETLVDIGADHIPILTVLNKADRLGDLENAQIAVKDYEDAVVISALTGEGIDGLLEAIHRKLYQSYTPISVHLPFQEGGLIALFHEQGQIEEIVHTRKGVFIDGRIPGRLVARYGQFINSGEDEDPEEVFEE